MKRLEAIIDNQSIKELIDNLVLIRDHTPYEHQGMFNMAISGLVQIANELPFTMIVSQAILGVLEEK